jgi:hypothetical protein
LQSRDFSRGRRDALIASPQYQFFHRRDIDFFIAAISIFSSPRY